MNYKVEVRVYLACNIAFITIVSDVDFTNEVATINSEKYFAALELAGPDNVSFLQSELTY